MKLLFVTGGRDCACKGSGKIQTRKPVKLGPDETVHTYVEVEEQCPCVEAHEATVERRGGMVSIGDPNIPVRQGTVVPKGVGVTATTVLTPDSYKED